ncbi:vWA domain-containing protein [Dyadobacter diqingensis]|uniref:vWA domain-containing protein n=1 Tax=Dyadobacter diqingensis TaxID=2938121 RepID=UPI0020C44DCA|nr:VWA domain-containing protein [Dyadobacter diqingensis]
MKRFLLFLLFFTTMFTNGYTQPAVPQQSLNKYVEFLNESAEILTDRFRMLSAYERDVQAYRKNNGLLLRLPSSGPLEEYYYKKAKEGPGLTAAERKQLNTSTDAIWQLLTKLDDTGKALETHVRLKAYQDDDLKQSNTLITEMQSVIRKFGQDKAAFYQQIQSVFLRYQPDLDTDPNLSAAKAMQAVLVSQQQLLESLPYYLNEETRADWPIDKIQQSMLSDGRMLSGFEKSGLKIEYPASSALGSFKSALAAIQTIKRHAIDDHNFAAKQNAHHGNEVYFSLLNQYNQDLLASYQSFVSYSQSVIPLLSYPALSPVFTPEPKELADKPIARTAPFENKPVISFEVQKAAKPASAATIRVLNDYVGFINESLRQMHLLQLLIRNYQSSAEYHRDPSRSRTHAALTYSHTDYKVPLSLYQLLTSASVSIPQPYRKSITGQAEVLLSILQEMDNLSIELIQYTNQKEYLKDQLRRSDTILDRYLDLFDIFDKKKEQLYTDVRRIHESYPNANPASSWFLGGSALAKTMDDDKEILFGVKNFLKGETNQAPNTEKSEAQARQLIADKYQNLNGLKRYGRSNGLCPYSPYEDLSANTSRLAMMAQKVKMPSPALTAHPYESFYYFYNNELVYQYNKFCELANAGLLQHINQPDVFAFRRIPKQNRDNAKPAKTEQIPDNRTSNLIPVTRNDRRENAPERLESEPKKVVIEGIKQTLRDTIYVERVRVDTVYLSNGIAQPEVSRSLNGFAANNMVLLLDVSASMDSPIKLPLLKKSVKSLLKLLRPEDQISIVVYSGKARVALKPTSGTKTDEIARAIDGLQSTGDTDGNEGIKLAYKVANKEYIRAGNNRIVLATDGEFPVSEEVLQLIGENARQDVYLSIFTFGKNPNNGIKLKKLTALGKGTYAHVTAENADLQLIVEAQSKKQADN